MSQFLFFWRKINLHKKQIFNEWNYSFKIFIYPNSTAGRCEVTLTVCESMWNHIDRLWVDVKSHWPFVNRCDFTSTSCAIRVFLNFTKNWKINCKNMLWQVAEVYNGLLFTENTNYKNENVISFYLLLFQICYLI